MSFFLLFRRAQAAAAVESNTDGGKARKRKRLKKENDELDLVLLQKRISAKVAADKARQALNVLATEIVAPKIDHEDEEELLLLTLH